MTPGAASMLSAERAEELRAQPFTYAPVGATASAPPSGWEYFTRSHIVNHGDFEGAVRDLMSWRVHERSGLTVSASSPTVADESVVELLFGVRPFALRIPCRVVYVVDEPDRRGFAYGTLPGHPERGEESFVVSRIPEGHVRFTVSAYSRPATRLARASGPLGRVVQARMTTRYLASLDR